jgi:4-coumarate--CoA ligase
LEKGEGRRKLAFLSFSSGTTGNPKAVAIPHHNVIANTLQTAHYSKANDPSVPWEERRFREGDVSLGGMFSVNF